MSRTDHFLTKNCHKFHSLSDRLITTTERNFNHVFVWAKNMKIMELVKRKKKNVVWYNLSNMSSCLKMKGWSKLKHSKREKEFSNSDACLHFWERQMEMNQNTWLPLHFVNWIWRNAITVFLLFIELINLSYRF